MFCFNCGIKVDDKVRFCPNCGTKLVNEQPTVQHVVEPVVRPVFVSAPRPDAVSATYAPSEYITSIEEKTKACVKKTLSSVLFLIAVILFTLSTVFGFISLFSDAGTEIYDEPGLFDKVSVSAEDYSIDDEFLDVIEFFDAGIIWIVGLWLTFAFAKSKKKMSTGGMTTLRVASRIDKIFAYIVAVFFVFDGIASTLTGTDAADLYFTIMFAAPVFLALGFVVVLFFHKVCSDIDSLFSISTTGIPTAKISRFVGIGLFFIAAIDIFMVDGGWADILYSLTEGTACLLFGISFFIFKKRIKGLAEEYKLANTPAVAGQTIINNNVMI